MPGFHSSTGQKRLESGVMHLVAEHQLAVDEAQLELGVGDDDAPLAGDGGAARVQLERDVPGLGGQLRADEVARPRSKEMFSSCTSLFVDGVNTGSGS